MTIEGMHYSENCECEGCKRVSGKSKKIGATSIHQAVAEDRERVVMEIRKRMPSHDAVMEYLSSLDKLTDK